MLMTFTDFVLGNNVLNITWHAIMADDEEGNTVEKLIGDNPVSVDTWMPKLLELMRADDGQFGNIAKHAKEVLEEKVFKAVKST